MLKKIIAASAALALLSLFACSNDDNKDPDKDPGSGTDPSSSSIVATPSSSSEDPWANMNEVTISMFAGKSVFGTYPYNYTLDGDGKNEDLTPFWKSTCDTAVSKTITLAQATACTDTTLMKTNAIMQNILTTRDAPLRYKIDGFYSESGYNAISLQKYNLVPNSQAALGLNISDPDVEGVLSIADKPTDISNAVAFRYEHSGGAHMFRAVVDQDNFWAFEVPATEEGKSVMVTVLFEDFLKGSRTTEMPFNLSKVTQFLWVAEYDIVEAKNNTGSLTISYFKGLVPK
jgi:hypothetical protein